MAGDSIANYQNSISGRANLETSVNGVFRPLDDTTVQKRFEMFLYCIVYPTSTRTLAFMMLGMLNEFLLQGIVPDRVRVPVKIINYDYVRVFHRAFPLVCRRLVPL